MDIYILSKTVDKPVYLDDIDIISIKSEYNITSDDINKLFTYEYVKIDGKIKIKILGIYKNKYIPYNIIDENKFYNDTENNNINIKICDYNIDIEDIDIYLSDCDELLLH